MKNVIIFGASGHGSVVLDILHKSEEFQPVGFVDSFIKKGTKKNGYRVLGSEFDLLHIIEKHNVYGGIATMGDHWVCCRLVLDEIPDTVVAYGSPARIIRKRRAGEPYLGIPRNRKDLKFPFTYTA